MDALLLPVLVKFEGKSEKQWRNDMRTWQEWDAGLARRPYAKLKPKIPGLVHELAQYQRKHDSDLYHQHSLTRQEFRAQYDGKGQVEFSFFSKVDPGTTCNLCGKPHGAGQGCIVAENLKRLNEELEPKIKGLTEVLAELKRHKQGGTPDQQKRVVNAIQKLEGLSVKLIKQLTRRRNEARALLLKEAKPKAARLKAGPFITLMTANQRCLRQYLMLPERRRHC